MINYMSLKTKFPRMSLNNILEIYGFKDKVSKDTCIFGIYGFKDKVSKDTNILGIYVLENKCPRSQLNDFWACSSFVKFKIN